MPVLYITQDGSSSECSDGGGAPLTGGSVMVSGVLGVGRSEARRSLVEPVCSAGGMPRRAPGVACASSGSSWGSSALLSSRPPLLVIQIEMRKIALTRSLGQNRPDVGMPNSKGSSGPPTSCVACRCAACSAGVCSGLARL